jgi:uncharacterized membrane protein
MNSFQWMPKHDAWVYVAVAAACASLFWLAWRQSRSPVARSWWLVVLRAALLGLLLLVLLNPSKVTETQTPPQPSDLVYLVDCSQSMGLDRPVSRLERVKKAISRSYRQAAADHVHILPFRFGEQMRVAAALDDFRAEDDATHLGSALEGLPARFGRRPAGVVLFSDGRGSEPPDLEEIAAGYRQLEVPVHVFSVGDASLIGDVAIQELVVPRNAPQATRLPVRVQIDSHGYDGQRAEIRIRAPGDPPEKALAVLPITLTGKPQTHELTILPGADVHHLLVEVPPLAGEATAENNQVPFEVGARKKKLRVIYMEGTTGGEYRFLRDALVEDPNIECMAMEVQYQYTRDQRLFRVDDPARGYPATREELFSYDIVICSDANRNAFTQEQLDWTEELVAKRGGGFAMIGGVTSYGAGQWDQTVWDGIIPVKMSGTLPGSRGPGYVYTPFGVNVPADVERHPIWRIVDDPVQNRQVLNRIPLFYGANWVDRVKPGATCLGLTDRPLPSGVGVMPLFACQSYGLGRTFAMMPDTTIDWGKDWEHNWGEGDNRYFRKFWRNVINWLGENSAGANRRLRIDTDKVIYRPGQPIEITVRAYDEKLEETDSFRLAARLRQGAAAASGRSSASSAPIAEAALAPAADDKLYRGRIKTPPFSAIAAKSPGSSLQALALEVTAYRGNEPAMQTSVDVQVLNDSPEFRDPRPDFPTLETIARSTGGKVLRNQSDLDGLIAACRPVAGEKLVTHQPLWDHPAFWFLLLLLLAVEWILRRTWGLA